MQTEEYLIKDLSNIVRDYLTYLPDQKIKFNDVLAIVIYSTVRVKVKK